MSRLAIAASFLALLSSPCMGDEIAAAPAHIVDAANRFAPGVRWESVGVPPAAQSTPPEDYRLKGRRTDGSTIEVDVSQAGDLLEIETPAEIADIPQSAVALMRGYLPSFQPMHVRRSERPGQQTVFELVGRAGSRAINVEVDAEGTNIAIADASAR